MASGYQKVITDERAARLERLSYDAIAARLNAMGVATRMGKAWVGATVGGLLKRGTNDLAFPA